MVRSPVRPRQLDRLATNILIYPDFARGTLDIMGSLQAKVKDDYRDAEPGKIPHEIATASLPISS